MRGIEIDEGAELDLVRLVAQLRRAAAQRASIPIHKGRATSDERKALRAARKRLAGEIEDAERGIISWALALVPADEPDDLEPWEDDSEEDDEDGIDDEDRGTSGDEGDVSEGTGRNDHHQLGNDADPRHGI